MEPERKRKRALRPRGERGKGVTDGLPQIGLSDWRQLLDWWVVRRLLMRIERANCKGQPSREFRERELRLYMREYNEIYTMVEIKKPSIKWHHFASFFLNNTQYDDVFKKNPSKMTPYPKLLNYYASIGSIQLYLDFWLLLRWLHRTGIENPFALCSLVSAQLVDCNGGTGWSALVGWVGDNKLLLTPRHNLNANPPYHILCSTLYSINHNL